MMDPLFTRKRVFSLEFFPLSRTALGLHFAEIKLGAGSLELNQLQKLHQDWQPVPEPGTF